MARILLVTTRASYRKSYNNFHYGVLSLGSYIRKNSHHQVEILDGSLYDYTDYLNILTLKAKTCDIIGFSIMTPQIGDTYRSILHLKNRNITPVIVVGGHHVNMYLEQTVQSELIDYAVYGEGEKGLLSLCNKLDSGESVDDIRSVVSKKKVGKYSKLSMEILDYNDLYDTDYDLIDPRMMDVLKNQFLLLTGRGCPYRCAFCYNSAFGNEWRGKSSQIVLTEIEELYQKYKFKKLYFRDEYFFAEKSRVKEVMEGLARRNYPFTWTTTCRVTDFRKKIDHEAIKLMVASKCEELKFGAESGSDRCLKFLKKGITVADTINAAKICAENNIRGAFSFLTGYPTEEHKDRIQTAQLIDNIKKISRGHVILGPFAYYIFPGGKLYDMIVANKEWNMEFPKSFEEWAENKYGNLFELQSEPERFAWLNEPDFVTHFNRIIFFRYLEDHIVTYRDFSIPQKIVIRLLLSPFILMTRIRWKFMYFGFLYDYRLYEWLEVRRRFLRKFFSR